MFSKMWNQRIISKVFNSKDKSKGKKATSKLSLVPLEDRIVPAVPFSPAFPYALSITNSGGTVTLSITHIFYNYDGGKYSPTGIMAPTC